MNKNAVIIIAIVIIGIFGFMTINNYDSVSDNSGTISQVSTVERYEKYSQEAFIASVDSERVLFFHASWCPTCIQHEKDILKKGVPEGIIIFKANFDSENDLKKNYGVNVQSTFVHVDQGGEVVKRWPFGQGINDITDLYEQVI